MITSASENKELATQFLEYMIEAKTQKAVSDVTGYDPANPAQPEHLMSAEQRQSLHLDDVDGYMAHIYFWQQVPRRDKYNEIWNEVKGAAVMRRLEFPPAVPWQPASLLMHYPCSCRQNAAAN